MPLFSADGRPAIEELDLLTLFTQSVQTFAIKPANTAAFDDDLEQVTRQNSDFFASDASLSSKSLSSGSRCLDSLFSGFKSGSIYELQGTLNSSRGKIIRNLIKQVAISGEKCLYINSEYNLSQEMLFPETIPPEVDVKAAVQVLKIPRNSMVMLYRTFSKLLSRFNSSVLNKTESQEPLRLIVINDFTSLVTNEFDAIEKKQYKNRSLIRKINSRAQEMYKFGENYKLSAFERAVKFSHKRTKLKCKVSERDYLINQKTEALEKLFSLIQRYLSTNTHCTVVICGWLIARTDNLTLKCFSQSSELSHNKSSLASEVSDDIATAVDDTSIKDDSSLGAIDGDALGVNDGNISVSTNGNTTGSSNDDITDSTNNNISNTNDDNITGSVTNNSSKELNSINSTLSNSTPSQISQSLSQNASNMMKSRRLVSPLADFNLWSQYLEARITVYKDWLFLPSSGDSGTISNWALVENAYKKQESLSEHQNVHWDPNYLASCTDQENWAKRVCLIDDIREEDPEFTLNRDWLLDDEQQDNDEYPAILPSQISDLSDDSQPSDPVIAVSTQYQDLEKILASSKAESKIEISNVNEFPDSQANDSFILTVSEYEKALELINERFKDDPRKLAEKLLMFEEHYKRL